MKVVERVQARYEVQEVEFGKVYKWRPERVVVECLCGQRLSLTASTTSSCVECGTDHTRALKEGSTDGWQSDENLHPWRYSEESGDIGLPFWEAAPKPVNCEGGFVRSEDVQRGMLVQVKRGSRKSGLRDRIGIVRQRFWNHSYSPFEVQFENVEDKKLELLWASEFEEAEEFYQHYG
jgi:hypothetical protein